MLEGIKLNNGDDVRIVYRHFPLISIHNMAQITAEAAEAAGAQGKFWEMHDLLYERQGQWGSYQGLSKEEKTKVERALISYANEYGLGIMSLQKSVRWTTNSPILSKTSKNDLSAHFQHLYQLPC